MGTARGANLLTSKQVERAKPRATDYYLRDGDGLFVRVYPSGRKTFVYRFEVDGKTRKVEHERSFGSGADALTLEAARAWRAEQKALRLAGRDPVQLKRSTRSLRRLQLTATGDYPAGSFGAVALEFQARVIEREYKDPAQFLRILKSDLFPALARRPIAELRLAEVQQVLNGIVDRGSKVAANRALLAAKKVMRYARAQGHLEVNPLADVSRRDVGGKEGQRQRALSDAEIVTFWRAIATHVGLSWQVRACLQLLLLTGQRIGETLLAQWRHFSESSEATPATWQLPAENTKPKRAHLVHLGSLAQELLATLPKPKRGPGWIFHDGNAEGAEPITRRAVTRALDRLLTAPPGGRPALPIDHFTPHDLRRTMRSRLADLGVLPHVAEKILNHQLGGVLQVYDRAEYLPERAQAIDAWDKKLRELLADEAGQVAFAPVVQTSGPSAKAVRSTQPRRPDLTTTATLGGDHG
jgi:integrase